MKRVYCLYRVSTVGQVDHDDIPLQRISCRQYAQQKGWTILRELYECGVSGYKVSSEARDAIQELKDEALLQRFDILLVFMFDRLGRRDDETPFVVEWFVKHGIAVWSVNEGEQRFDTHVDKLMNYIRYWQASGESEKTSIRVRLRQEQMIQDGHFRGGMIPYGYRLEYTGRANKKNQPVHDLVIDPFTSENVKLIFSLVSSQGYGANRIAMYLNERNILPRTANAHWHASSIRAILRNPIYIGIMRMGACCSERSFAQYRIISDEQYEAVQKIMLERSLSHTLTRSIPYRTDNAYLLTGLLRCGSCGSRLFGATMSSKRASAQCHRRYYRCYTSSVHRGVCNGQRCYAANRIERMIEDRVVDVLNEILSTPVSELAEQMNALVYRDDQRALQMAQIEIDTIACEIEKLEQQLVKSVIKNDRTLTDAINDAVIRKRQAYVEAEREYRKLADAIAQSVERRENMMLVIRNIRSWAVNYKLLKPEEKRMILPQMIEQVVVSKGHGVEIVFRSVIKELCQMKV